MRTIFLRAAAACLAAMTAAAAADARGSELARVRTFILSGGRAAHGPKDTELRVAFVDKAHEQSSIVWTGLGEQMGYSCIIEGGSYVRGSIRADRGGALSLRLIDRREVATDVIFERGRLNFLLRGRLAAAYVLTGAGRPSPPCAPAPSEGTKD